MTRKIIHIDMDAFYASVEERDNPRLKGRPIAVGGGGKRGVIATANYAARKYGVGSAMPGFIAKNKCPHLIFIPPRMEAYKKASHEIREIFRKYTDIIEPLSLDEAFLDVTKNKIQSPSAVHIAQKILHDIYKKTRLTASAGISNTKFLAKVASDINKPSGVTLILPEQAMEFLGKLPIKKFFGIGKVTAEKMHRLNIFTGKDLQNLSMTELVRHFGNMGPHYYKICRNEDQRTVEPNTVRKSVGVEDTFPENIADPVLLLQKITQIAENCWKRSGEKKIYGRTITIKIRDEQFVQKTKSKTFPLLITHKTDFIHRVLSLWEEVQLSIPIRLLGVSISGFETATKEKPQESLF